jgi:hypothetical protein
MHYVVWIEEPSAPQAVRRSLWKPVAARFNKREAEQYAREHSAIYGTNRNGPVRYVILPENHFPEPYTGRPVRRPRTSADVHVEAYARDLERERRGLLASGTVANPFLEAGVSAHEREDVEQAAQNSHPTASIYIVWVRPSGALPTGTAC